MDFQVQEQTYFINLAEEGWEVLVATPSGAMPIPVYVDAAEMRPIVVVQDEKRRMPN
jgi:hypothetical protein